VYLLFEREKNEIDSTLCQKIQFFGTFKKTKSGFFEVGFLRQNEVFFLKQPTLFIEYVLF
jgi:hypothetical protein